ncbi:MAG: hypothetical protein GY932_10985 [Arcobacter sp.]|nr:hypothetical protein [Arcobacter sp.]
MIRFYIYLILFYSFININGQNQKWVKGRVLTVVNNVKIPIKNIIVVINETGDKDKTDDNGNFRVKLKESYFAGEKISVSIEKENWTIHYPLNGEFYIPNNLEKELVKIQILPIGSKLFLSNDHLEKLFENLIKNINNKYIINKHPKKIDLPKRIQDWAKIYGFTVDEVKYKVSEWIENVESQKEDGYKLGLAAFVKKEYEKAGKFFNKTAKEKETKLISVNNEINLLNKKQKKLINEIIKNCQNEGNSFFEISKYKLAAKAYENALKYANTSKLWSDLMLKKSSVYTELLLRDNGPFVLKYLRLAIESYDSLLTSSNSKYIKKQY